MSDADILLELMKEKFSIQDSRFRLLELQIARLDTRIDTTQQNVNTWSEGVEKRIEEAKKGETIEFGLTMLLAFAELLEEKGMLDEKDLERVYQLRARQVARIDQLREKWKHEGLK